MRFIIKGTITKKDLIKKVAEAPYLSAKRLDISLTAIKEGRYEVDEAPGIVVEEAQYKNVKNKESGLSELILDLTEEEHDILGIESIKEYEAKNSSNKKTVDSVG